MTIKQGDIVYVDLEPSKGNKMRKTRPWLVVSNNDYNRYFNTTLVLPISSSSK
ncbi:toxin-antitoxin system, toxin component, MazF family [Lentilactobacillus hilgardii ATCC 27305]|jgi:mRNA interferase MazF|nr:type II toxin-antitoxin system PemK/MazF family toxin [Lentilactobacillus hilgardii]EEI71811.1 toxin-antitoxin system, toxin component, MazF family [Lentilactobacillus hilgardii ATCC 27305]